MVATNNWIVIILVILLVYAIISLRFVRDGISNTTSNKDNSYSISNDNYSFTNGSESYYHADYNDYPKHIPIYQIRRDIYTNKEVSRNRLSLLGGLLHADNINRTKVTFEEFKKILQCPLYEPDLIGKRGSLYLYKLAPITRKMIENVCAFLQTGCSPWNKCLKSIPTDKRQQRIYKKTSRLDSPYDARLMRIINNELYYDWPWGKFHEDNMEIARIKPIFSILLRVSDIGNSVFIMGYEASFLPFNVHIPAFSNAPRLQSSEMPWPWLEALINEEEMMSSNYSVLNNINNWTSRIPKAVFYGTLTTVRQIFFDIATRRSDIIVARWVGGTTDAGRPFSWNPEHTEAGPFPWNPESMESEFDENDKRFDNDALREKSSAIGTLENLLKLRLPSAQKYDVTKYKFAVVLLGLNGKSTANRLSTFLAYSGCVILMQEHEFAYTFSERLKPWVHYVPLSYNTADIIDKIEYLLANDDLAERLATNAKNFGLSHLRLEDYLCYVATALKTVSNITSGTDAIIPFNAEKINLPSVTY